MRPLVECTAARVKRLLLCSSNAPRPATTTTTTTRTRKSSSLLSGLISAPFESWRDALICTRGFRGRFKKFLHHKRRNNSRIPSMRHLVRNVAASSSTTPVRYVTRHNANRTLLIIRRWKANN